MGKVNLNDLRCTVRRKFQFFNKLNDKSEQAEAELSQAQPKLGLWIMLR